MIALPAIALSVAVLLPFVGSAYTIDDTLFLREAEHMLRDPLHPTAFTMVWGEAPERFSTILSSGPVGAALLLPAVIHGGAEWIAHGMQIVMLALALLGTARLALRLGLEPQTARMATLVVACTPAVLGMAGTAMPDVAAMTFGVWAVERMYAFREEGRWHQGAAALVLLAVGVLTRAHLVLLAPIGALLLPRNRWAVLAGGPALALVVVLGIRDPQHGSTLAGAVARYSTGRSLDRNLVAFAAHWVLALPLALPWLLVRRRALPWRVAIIATPIAGVLLVVAEHTRWLWVAPIAAVGAVVLADIVREAWRARNFVLAGWLFIALPTTMYVHVPAKYLIVSAPAVALLVAPRMSRMLAAATCAVGLALGILILSASASFAGMGRMAANELIEPATARGENVWFLGHWGFQWYAERAGGKAMGRPPPAPAAGDHVVTEAQGLNDLGRFLPPSRHLEKSVGDATPGGRIMSRAACAGFFSNAWGYLPWSFGTADIDRFDVWRVE